MDSNCTACNRSFKSAGVLKRHEKYSPRHKKDRCGQCNKTFKSAEGLQQHLQTSKAHANSRPGKKNKAKRPPGATPLDRFFLSFPSLGYDPAAPPATSWMRLRSSQGWKRDDPEGVEAWSRYQKALEDEVRVWFGREDDMTAWHTLCRAIGIHDPPQTPQQCIKITRNTHVNIVDLIEWGRTRAELARSPVRVFARQDELKEYTLNSSKIFPVASVQSDGEETNIVLRHLLRRFFR